MKKLFFLILICFSVSNIYSSNDYICYYLISTEIRATVDEHGRQEDLQEEQLLNMGAEKMNEGQWSEYRDLTEKIRSRLHKLSFAVQAIPASVNIVREIDKIYDIQSKIQQELSDAPQWIPLTINGQISFVNELQMNIRLMAGIILNYGTINQMEKAERKELLDFTVKEIKTMRVTAWTTLSAIKIAKRKEKQRKAAFAGWVNKDKKLIKDILKNASAY